MKTVTILPAVLGATLALLTGCATLEKTSTAAAPATSTAPAEPTVPIATEAKTFMDDYARDLQAGNKDAIIARYHSQGVFILAVGIDDLMRPKQLGEFYKTQWQAPHAFTWKNLRFRTLSSETILIEGGFDWQQTAAKPAQYFSYVAILVREGGGRLRIRSEIEFPEEPES